MNILSPNQNTSFTSRSPQIRDAQWVARKVRAIPHISTTRISAPMWNLKEQNYDLYTRFSNKKSFEHFYAKNEHEQKLIRLFSWQKQIIKKLSDARQEWGIGRKDDFRRVSNILGQFKYERLGNCGEDAFLSGAIVKMNGVQNVYNTKLKIDNSPVDHVVCIFNADGKIFDGKIKNNTIIIDSWIGEADFASNVFQKYKNEFSDFFIALRTDSKISFDEIKRINLSDKEELLLTLKHPELIYPSSDRCFMQKK